MDTLPKSLKEISRCIGKVAQNAEFMIPDFGSGKLPGLLNRYCEKTMGRNARERSFCLISTDKRKPAIDGLSLEFTYHLKINHEKKIKIEMQEVGINRQNGPPLLTLIKDDPDDAGLITMRHAKRIARQFKSKTNVIAPGRPASNLSLDQAIARLNDDIKKLGYNTFCPEMLLGELNPGYKGMHSSQLIDWSEKNQLAAGICSPNLGFLPLRMQTLSDVQQDKSVYTRCTFDINQEHEMPIISNFFAERCEKSGKRLVLAIVPVNSSADVPDRGLINHVISSICVSHKRSVKPSHFR